MVYILPSRGKIYTMYHRAISSQVAAALTDTPIVLLIGARQVGKTTLAQTLLKASGTSETLSLTLDDPVTLSAARTDPVGFLARAPRSLHLDEVQRAPELFLPLKATVDRDRRPGRFLLTGSANVLALPRLSDSLAGRMEILTLSPLTQAEIEGKSENAIDRLFAGEFPHSVSSDAHADLWERITRGGFPEATLRADPKRRQAWFSSYLGAILQRDVQDLAHIEGLTQLPNLLTLLATRTTNLLNVADLSRMLGIANTTLHRYLTLLETIFLYMPLPAWHANLGLRLSKSPKVLLTDTGLALSLLSADEARLASDAFLRGAMLETFVMNELLHQLESATGLPRLYHFRTQGGVEVDGVLERKDGRLFGVEVKASSSVSADDFRHLKALQMVTGEKFVGGAVFYTGAHTLPFGEKLIALPIASLWQF